MSCSTLLTNNSTATSVAASGVITLGSAIHGYGRGITLNGSAIQISSNGYYNIDADITVAVTGATAISAQLYKNGTAISGATASSTPAAAGDVVDLHIPWMVRRNCCGCMDSDAYTIVLSAAGTVNNCTVRVERV